MITLICGPPCAGKSTLARERAGRDDIVLDFDDIAMGLGSPRRWQHSRGIIIAANHVMQVRMRALAGRIDVTAWVIQCAPRAARREALADTLSARIWMVDPGIKTCLRRARERPLSTAAEIHKWYRLYTPSPRDRMMAT